tara:strand:- start:2097 stop:2471 length:375 start_codon:yes stop_codon:yes gene_type:complete
MSKKDNSQLKTISFETISKAVNNCCKTSQDNETLFNNSRTQKIEFMRTDYKTSNETNNYFQGYRVRLFKLIGGFKNSNKTFKQVLSVFEVKAENWQKFKTMFINDLVKLETKYYFIDDSIIRGN